MIKYLGSKRLLVPVLGRIASAVGARTAVDLFTGTTRVAQEFKRRGLAVTAVDVATYAEVLARCYVATDARAVDHDRLAEALGRLNGLRG
ncbi:MAG TPA: DNA adenine methylase, partial [Marmoricola sp.]